MAWLYANTLGGSESVQGAQSHKTPKSKEPHIKSYIGITYYQGRVVGWSFTTFQ